MRQMTDGVTTLKIVKHIILRNFWEYYIDSTPTKDGICTALVMGFETEYGDVDINEIRPYIISSTNKLNDILPAQGWKWVD